MTNRPMRRMYVIVSQGGKLVACYSNQDLAFDRLEHWQSQLGRDAVLRVRPVLGIEPGCGGTHIADKPDFDLCAEILEG